MKETGRAVAWVGPPAKVSEIPQRMKKEDSLAWLGLSGHAGRSSGSGQGSTLGVGEQRELLNSEIL